MDNVEIEEVISEMEEFYEAEVVPSDETMQEWIFRLKRAISND